MTDLNEGHIQGHDSSCSRVTNKNTIYSQIVIRYAKQLPCARDCTGRMTFDNARSYDPFPPYIKLGIGQTKISFNSQIQIVNSK